MKRLTRIISACVALVLLLSHGAFAASINDPLVNFQTDTAIAINQARASIKVGALTLDPQLNECARILALEMEGLKGDEPRRPNGKTWDSVLDEQGYYVESGFAARNRYTSATAPDSASLSEHWMGSAGLRANALNSQYTATGIYGYYSAKHEMYYVVQIFAKPAKVEPGGYISVTDRDLYVYDGPSASKNVIWMISKGNEVSVQSVIGSWAKIAIFGGSGYVQSAYLTRKELTPTPSPVPTPTPAPGIDGNYEATTGVNVRSGPGTHYAVIGGLDRGDRVNVIGKSGTWHKIEWNRGSAYVHTAYLRSLSSTAPAPTPDSGNSGQSGANISKAKSNVNVRSGPSTRYKRLGTLYRGELVTVHGYEGNWARVSWRGYASVYVSKSYLSAVK